MRVLAAGLTLIGAALAVDVPAITQEMIDEINAMGTTWQAAMPVKFANATREEAMRYMGTILRGDPRHMDLPLKTEYEEVGALPTNFDAREHWSQCSNVIGHVRDQSACGSCWAFGSTEAFNDRYCIKTGSQLLMSPTDTLACCTGFSCGFSMGCNGGQPSGAWSFFQKQGVVTGGDYSDVGTGASCKPYPFAPCAHHVEPTAEYPACPSTDYKTPKCTSTCSESSYKTAYSNDKFFAKSSYSVRAREDDIMNEIYTKGTVSVAMSVYDDFLSYAGGVYQHKTGSYLGGHAIKMIGWGVEDNTPYWLCVNSWNDSWGDKGTFKILRGSNECGIEGDVVAGDL
jgi:cathepsin B